MKKSLHRRARCVPIRPSNFFMQVNVEEITITLPSRGACPRVPFSWVFVWVVISTIGGALSLWTRARGSHRHDHSETRCRGPFAPSWQAVPRPQRTGKD